MQLTVVYVTLLVSFLGATYGYDCNSRLENDVKQCFQDQGLLSDHPTGDASAVLRKAQMIYDEAHCRKIDLYKNATVCIMEYAKLCLQQSGLEGFLPDNTKMLQGMDFLCKNYQDFDSRCVQNRLDDIEQCGKNLMKGVIEKYRKASSRPSTNEIICITTDLVYDCSEVHLASCPKRTKALYLEILDKYTVPPECQDRPPGRLRVSYIGSRTISPTTVSSLGATYGYDSVNSLQSHVRPCFLNEGLDFNQTVVEGELLSRAPFTDSETLCRKIDLYKNAWECVMGYLKLCLRGSMRLEGVLPDTTAMLQGIDFLCQNYQDFDCQCLQNRLNGILQCVMDLMEKYRIQHSRTENICPVTDLAYDCSDVYLASCPQGTKAIYLELLDKYMVPTACQDRPPGRSRISYTRANTASRTTLFHPSSAVLVAMATLIFLRWSG